MIVKIPVSDLQPGMYVRRFDCGWLQHPFLFNRRKVKSAADIERLKNWGVRHVYVEVEHPRPARPAPEPAPVQPPPAPGPLPMADLPEMGAGKQVPLSRELVRAEKARRQAKTVAKDLLRSVREGKELKLKEAETAVSGLDTSISHNKDALLLLMRLRNTDEYTFEHSVNVGVLLLAFCHSLGFDRETTRTIGLGGLLHDVGKMAVPPHILNKPGKLSEEEFRQIKEHVLKARRILAATAAISLPVAKIALEHHERFDGTGYPYGLNGEAISRGGQMASIADVFDALSADRCYHRGMEQAEVLRRLYGWRHSHFNAELVQRFIKCIGIFPPGTLVRLESGMLAVVVESGQNLLQPVVRLVYDTNRDWAVFPRDLDLAKPGKGGADRIICHELPARWGINPLKALEVT
ncbi:HD-GYP domain-containing protein [Desulfurivibrio alkaliphilus]|uniref:Metal dependent phosphohydrolase n=1 Tax=Desulfurivibrio alkaliphilus (strain DSM 19089 / UNIQEM U267 / AHT2) TaxID=589865 RepID=D6Z026_DESAT|nr:HD-GYP domain-containing protein [Desulfurivibrio alkaliphilus]ADH87059.1 metal dependent phosphohydrolase [Desulfurivibrio alkaliphilus AHT 2]